jgi:opacity protein-like surface antigen
MKKSLLAIAATAVLAISTATAAGAYTLDEAASTGWVGKGEVQTAFGWNNAQLQQRGKDVTFSYGSEDSYQITCQWEAGKSGNIQTRVRERAVTVALDVTGVDRKNPQGSINGYFLTLGEEVATGGDVPAIGGTCQAEGNDGQITEVTPLGSTGGGLSVTYGTTTVLLP